MTKQSRAARVISGSFLIAGTMIGAGMLGIPAVTSISGFWPGALAALIVWFFMYCTGLLFLKVTLQMPDGSNILSIAGHFLGKGGRLFSGGVFIFLYYSLMVAYFSAGAPLLANGYRFLGGDPVGWEPFALFGLLFGSIVAIGPRSIDRVNIVMSVAMIASWFTLIGSGGGEVEPIRLEPKRWSTMVFAMPVLFSAFGFHNIIPSLCTYLHRDKTSLRRAIFWGSFLPLVVYIVWQWLVIGAVPPEALRQALREGTPITDAFGAIAHNPFFAKVGQWFAFFAIVTSTLGVAFSMVDFFRDGWKGRGEVGLYRVGLTTLVFFPPFLAAFLNPGIFTTALGVAGGFGEAFLNGLLPILLVWACQKKERHVGEGWLDKKEFLTLLALYAAFVIALETAHLLGLFS